MKKIWWIIGGVCCVGLIIVVALLVGVAMYFGLSFKMPNFAEWNKPKDLGITYTDADLQAGRKNIGVKFEDIDSGSEKSIAFEGVKDISGVYTNEMITALIDNAKYVNYPVTNAQVRINPDGTIETSGNFDVAKAMRWTVDLNADPQLTQTIQTYASTISSNPNFYLKGTMSVTNNKFDLNIQEAQISFFSPSKAQIDQYQGPLASFVEDRIANVPNMNIKSADFSTGKLVLDATYPAIEKTVKK